jgi:hypothetical protein
MKCANCGTESKGSFCPSCGAQLRASSCPECGADLPAGARFCTRCGTGVGASGARASTRSSSSSPNLPWYIAGAVLLVLILILLVPMLMDRDSGPTTPFAPMGGATAPGAPPPLEGTPREQADRLFNRIMTAREQGDTVDARRFTPMAIDAYRMAEPLDNDGLYHLAAVHIVAGDHAAARATADQLLAREPNHLLGLSAAGEAALLAGDTASAREHYQRLLRVYDTESARGLQEYLDHARQLPELRETARQATGS